MRPLPTPPAPGKPVSATLIRQLIDAIRERTVLAGRNVSLKRGPNGTVVDSTSSGTAAVPAADQLHPWKVFGHDSESSGYLFSVYVPSKVLSIGSPVEIEGIGEIEDKPTYYTFDDEVPDGTSYAWLLAYTSENESGDDGELEIKAIVAIGGNQLNPPEIEDSVETIFSALIATLSVEDGKGKVISQALTYHPSAFAPIYYS